MKTKKQLFSKLFKTKKKKSKRVSRRTKSKPTQVKLFSKLLKSKRKKSVQQEQTIQAAQLPAEVPTLQIQQQIEIQPTPQPKPNPQLGLHISDLLRPQAKVKSSMEGFMLDKRSEHTRRAYGKDIKRFVKYLHARHYERGDELLSRGIIIGYKDYLLQEKLEHTSIDRHLATLRSFFRWLTEDGHFEKNPSESVRFLNPKKLSTTQAFTDEEVKKVLAMPNLHTKVGSQHYAILMILFYCGLRRSEICEIKTQNLFIERDQMIVKLRGKGNKERLIPLIQPVRSALEHYFRISTRKQDKDSYLFSPFKNARTGELQKPLDSTMIYYIVTKYAKMAGIAKRVSPHSCRATAISNARDHDVADRAIQEFAGWASTHMITRYDKRKTAIEDSAAHAISYGDQDRKMPWTPKGSADS